MKTKFKMMKSYLMLPLYLLACVGKIFAKFAARKSKPAIALLVAVVMVFSSLPLTAYAAEGDGNPYYNRVVDVNTMDNWTKYFDLENLDTSNAGGVWTDKSVFTDASAFPNSVKMINDGENFLTALSALAANKEVVGYSTVPTDTVLVLDLSGSMENSESESDLIKAANNAISELLAVNENNRVGVVLYSAAVPVGTSTYSESVTRILPIDRYTTGRDGVYLSLSNNGNVSVDGDVEGTVSNADLDNDKSFGGGTYIQAGLWEAMKMFKEMDTVIGENNWQSGDNRMPIMVLMSDGAPSTGTSYYADVENSRYTTRGFFGGTQTVYESDVGNGNEDDLTAGNAFLTQLTASYVMNQVKAHYQQQDADVRGLFYTLGFNIGNNNVAQSVMNPDNSTFTDSLWNTYNGLTSGSMSVRVKNRSGSQSDVSITKNSYATSKSYVDEYFSASGDGLTSAFDSIVEEIILQSRYYPTHLEGGSPDFSGYVEFKDTIGEYMEVKDIKGILLGDTLYDGHMMASKISDNSSDGLGTVENPTDLGDEFIRAVKTRLGIAETAVAQSLVADAFAAGQLKYNSPTDWSNYIAWYAKADGTYAGFWNESSTAAPANAVYKIKSYGFLGETTGSIKNSDMMYMSVQVRTNIATGEQTMLWKIPAALIPLITYSVTLEGTNVDQAKNVELSVENADNISPIRLVFESGLRSDLNELNITRITDSKHIAADGVTRQFWTNYFDIDPALSHDKHITSLAEFTPSKENERFYYTFDSAVHKRIGEKEYVLVEKNETLNPNGEYYHRRYIFTDDSDEPIFLYEKMSSASIVAAEWKDDFKLLNQQRTGAYVVPAGTPARELTMYDEEKNTNVTKSAEMVFHPYLTEQNDMFYVDMNLGNNGLLEVTPAQGIKLSKTIDVYESGTSTDFAFRITVHNASGTAYTGSLDRYITDLDVVPTGDATAIRLSSTGTYVTNLSANQTLWLTGLPTGATYTIEEISDNSDYKVKSVHVNGTSTGSAPSGTIAAYFIDDVDFVNTPTSEGDLVITKQVVDQSGNTININDNVTFSAEVTLTDESGAAVYGTYKATNAAGEITIPSSGKFTIALKEGESFAVRGLPEETKYSVEEINIPRGFSFNASRSSMQGVITAEGSYQALIVNTYNPVGTNGQNVTIDVTKQISGNRTTWLNGESYSFEVNLVSITRAVIGTVGDFTIDYNDTDKKYTLNLSGEDYLEAGTYRYTITELSGNQKGITYDTADRRFAVVVADSDMDGDLEITAVNNESNTVVTKSGNNYTVAAIFNNVYQPTDSATVEIDVVKRMDGEYRLNGFQFALYNANPLTDENADEIMRSTVTDVAGNAKFTLTYAPNLATATGTVFTYYLAEIDTGNPNITYSKAVYKVEVTLKDKGDGTTTATPDITIVSGGELVNNVPVFDNVFTPSEEVYVTLTANKSIKGERVLNANEFSFVIEALTDGAPMPANSTIKNAANGAVVFDAIKFENAGTYKYKIYESQANKIGGFEYDGKFYEVTVNVIDNAAKLYASVTRVVKENENDTGIPLLDNEIMTFTNEYNATPATVKLVGEKLLTGKKLTNDFTFVLSPNDVNNPMPSSATVNNDGAKFEFGDITFNKAGVYTYTLTEQPFNDDRYDFDESVYEITVTVTDNSQGKLSARVDMKRNNITSTAIVFRNGFVPTPLDFNIDGLKVLDGREFVAGEFEFKLMNATTGVQIGQTVKNDADGKFVFPAVKLHDEGEYHFRISEVIGTEKGITYDTAIYHIFVDVDKNDSGDLIKAQEKLYKGTVVKEEVGGVLTEVVHYDEITDGSKITFNNSYKAEPAYVTLEATKILSGRDLIDGEFKFDLHKTDAGYEYNEDTVVEDDIVLTLNTDGTGNVTFMPLVFNDEGDYFYVIVEDEPANDKGVTSDETVYEVRITVTDNNKGDLVAKVFVDGDEIDGNMSDTVKFHNYYKAAATEIVIEGTKKLEGRDIKDGEFSFELYDSDNQKLEAVKNAADGKFTFTAIPVEEAGEYVYTVRELNDAQDNITYDDSVYTVTVTVTDNLDGTFKVEYAYADGDAKANGMTFVNTYKADAPEPKPEPKPQLPTEPEAEKKSPQTGDGSNLSMWFAVMFVSGGYLFGTIVYGKLKKKQKEN